RDVDAWRRSIAEGGHGFVLMGLEGARGSRGSSRSSSKLTHTRRFPRSSSYRVGGRVVGARLSARVLRPLCASSTGAPGFPRFRRLVRRRSVESATGRLRSSPCPVGGSG